MSGPVMGQCLDTLQALVGAGFGQAETPGSSGCVCTGRPCQGFLSTHIACLLKVWGLSDVPAGQHEALFRIDLGIMPWHS